MPDIDALEERLRTALTRLEYDWTVPAEIIASTDYHELERTRLWGRSWVFLDHESEIPDPGDYVVRNTGDSQFIVTRDEPGACRAHFNSCRLYAGGSSWVMSPTPPGGCASRSSWKLPKFEKRKQVVEQVHAQIDRDFSMHMHTQAWRYFGVRPPSDSPDQYKTRSEFCVMNELVGKHVYTPAWVKFLVRRLSDPAIYEEIASVK